MECRAGRAYSIPYTPHPHCFILYTVKQNTYTPPFTLTAKSISMIAEIAALSERFAIRMEQQDALRLRKINKIKTIRSSLAIEGNTLSEGQVADILEGRKVIAPLREIQEVKNAIATYDLYPQLDPFSINDMLKAHKTMMSALIDEAGNFRCGDVGVINGAEIIHVAPPANRVPMLMHDLFDWLKTTEDHLLIRSCVFHYEFEFIHPFSDGNGRMGRLWQSLILGKFNPQFQFLPVETMIHNNQQEYYDALSLSTHKADCGVFVDFMLNEILQSLKQNSQQNGGVNGSYGGTKESAGGINGANVGVKEPAGVVYGIIGGANERSGGISEILLYIQEHGGCRAGEIARTFSISLRTVERCLAALKSKGEIEFRGARKNGGYWMAGD